MEAWELQQAQSLPLELKIIKSQQRIREWYEHWRGEVYVSFSGGKDSTVLLHLVRTLYPDVPAVYCDTGLEYPEIRRFVMGHEDITVIRPKMGFRDVLGKYGYPVVSKEQSRYVYDIRHTKSEKLRDLRLNGSLLHNGQRGRLGVLSKRWRFLLDAPFEISSVCCEVMKKRPLRAYEKEGGRHPMTGEMAADSRRRASMYLMRNCNGFDMRRPKSTPLGFWREQDVLEYLRRYDVPYCPVYGEIETRGGVLETTGCERTGCMFCMFGVHLERGENRFIRMRRTHPKLWSYCVSDLGIGVVLDYIGIPYA